VRCGGHLPLDVRPAEALLPDDAPVLGDRDDDGRQALLVDEVPDLVGDPIELLVRVESG
jgi:hypothetical protein